MGAEHNDSGEAPGPEEAGDEEGEEEEGEDDPTIPVDGEAGLSENSMSQQPNICTCGFNMSF